ncbi:MAG: thiol peroxidase [Calditrichia bacterium]
MKLSEIRKANNEGGMMDPQKNSVMVNGTEFQLAGKTVSVGDKAPEFHATDMNMNPVDSKKFEGKVRIFLTLSSLDTPVCDTETRRFNAEAANLSGELAVVTISMDLPFAQKKWAENSQAKNILLISDYQDASFGRSFGVLIEKQRLLARTVFVVDRQGLVRYREIVPDISQEPDYDSAVKAAKNLL